MIIFYIHTNVFNQQVAVTQFYTRVTKGFYDICCMFYTIYLYTCW